MRTFALSGVAVLAVSLMASTAVLAWSSEQATPNTGATTNLADPDEALKALQDKVDAKNIGSQSGFYITGGAAQQQPFGPLGFHSNQTTTEVPFGYSPMPGFRGQPQ